MNKLFFGTAGIPVSCVNDRNTVNGVKKVKELKLEAMELEFVRSINLNEKSAKEVGRIARKEDIVLTCHAPYFINLNADSKIKLNLSKKRIINSAKISSIANAWSVCFHPGYYMKQDKKKVFDRIHENLKDIVKELKKDDVKIWIRPETTGKINVFGDLDECLKLSELDMVMPCVDFAHLHARTGGFNSSKEFDDVFEKIEKKLGREGLNNMHIHVSGINYSDKGERNHLNLKNSDFKYKELIKSMKKFKIKGVVISESPNIEEDALLMKNEYFK